MASERSQADRVNTPTNDANQLQRLADLIELEPDIASYNTDWRSITLETFDLPPGETPEFCLENYTVGIYLGPSLNVQIRQITENKCEEAAFSLGSVAIFPVHCPHFFAWNSFSQALCLTLKPDLLHLHATELLSRDRVELLPKLGLQDGLIYQIGLALQADLQREANCDRLYAESLANALALHLLKHYSTSDHRPLTGKGGLSQQKLKLVTDYINDNLERELSLSELAELVQLSQYHFCRLFKHSMGLSPHKYVTHQRVEKAKRLLKQGSMTLSEIAMACGFNHQSHLHRHFKRQTGVTPKTWLNS